MTEAHPFFADPILNSPYDCPGRHWELNAAGQPTRQILAGRRGAQAIINELRENLDSWRQLPPSAWQVTPETARLLRHWRQHDFQGVRPFFCQVEAAETAIWLAEVARHTRAGRRFLEHLRAVNEGANGDLPRLALKLATGAGKTTVMAMLIAWLTVNAVRRPGARHFTRGFLVVAPGLTIKNRLQVLQPNHAEDYYSSRELVPSDMLGDIRRAKIVITNYHAFRLRERIQLSAGGRALLQGRTGEQLQTTETEGQMIQRVMPELMGMKNIMVLNDEAHHCYREKPLERSDEVLKGDEKKEAETNNAAARLWITGLESVNRNVGICSVIDLSATPFYLRGSRFAQGTLFPWTLSDFPLMDAIECGIVKLPRVPISDNIACDEMPLFRNLWEHIRDSMPRRGRAKKGELDPRDLPAQLRTALQALYGHYERTFELWERTGLAVPPCFIVVCNNTSTSKLVYDYISDRLPLFRNHDEHGSPLTGPRTILIDSEQLESGEGLDDRLREVTNTVGKAGRLGASIRCVVSVAMLTEGWDANTVTHILGVRAFGTQLLCEQVIGRALRRQSYELNEAGRFNVEYADVLGIPFDFTAEPTLAPPQVPRESVQVRAIRPDRDALEIQFPRVEGYRTQLPDERLTAKFNEDSILELTPDLLPMDSESLHADRARLSQVTYELTSYVLKTRFHDGNGQPLLYLFGQLKRIVRQWLEECLVCTGATHPAQLKHRVLADQAAEKIFSAVVREPGADRSIKAMLDPCNPIGSTAHVRFNTSKERRWQTDARRCHINWVVLDSDREGEFCRLAESHPCVRSYVRNHNLGFEVPYRCGAEARKYLPDFVVLVNDGRGEDDLLNLVVEIQGYGGEDVQDKRTAMQTCWVPGVNNRTLHGRWAFADLSEAQQLGYEFDRFLNA
jgi:type III restriction enzyme